MSELESFHLNVNNLINRYRNHQMNYSETLYGLHSAMAHTFIAYDDELPNRLFDPIFDKYLDVLDIAIKQEDIQGSTATEAITMFFTLVHAFSEDKDTAEQTVADLVEKYLPNDDGIDLSSYLKNDGGDDPNKPFFGDGLNLN